MSDTYRVNTSLTTTAKIEALNEMIMLLEGQIDQAKFNVQEIGEIYSGSGIDRKYLRDIPIGHTAATYGNWTQPTALPPEEGYSIWKIAPTNYTYEDVNNLYFDNKILTNRGEAASESATTFDKVYLYDGSSYTDDTTEAGTPEGTPFDLMEVANIDFLYLGSASTFKGAKFEFDTRGSNYTLTTQIFCSGASANAWVNLGDCDGYIDDTSDFESDASIKWHLNSDTGAGWVLTSINSQTKYWARIKTTSTPITVAKANYLIPSSSVIGLLALSSSQIIDEAWAWCTYDTNIYVTIRNTGAAAYEGDYYIKKASTDTNLQNFLIFNHEFKADYRDSTYDEDVPLGMNRYRTVGNNSYYETFMQTGAGTYAWVKTRTNSW